MAVPYFNAGWREVFSLKDLSMRLVPVFALGLLVLAPLPAEAQSTRDACTLLDKNLLTETLGQEPELREENGAGTGVSLCSWRGGEGEGVRVHSITAVSQNIVGGTPLEYFKQHQGYKFEELTAANVATIEGPWQAGYLVDVTTEPNPDQLYVLTFINKDDTVTIETYGLPKETTVALAESVARGM
ncbi:hypothetical protein ASG47_08135 [Devosia sp. Leaf420]|nr:hypothetical protein ASG47_08135 [Devosia sp. Leaf420]